jgi:hypothetical protein
LLHTFLGDPIPERSSGVLSVTFPPTRYKLNFNCWTFTIAFALEGREEEEEEIGSSSV